METLFVCSVEPYTGKTSICLGLGLLIQERGLRLGYFKPIGTMPVDVEGVVCDEDTLFMREQFKIEDQLKVICPLVFSHSLLRETVSGSEIQADQVVMDSYDRISKDREFMLIEAGPDIGFGRFLGISSPQIAEKLNLPVILVLRYNYPENVDQALLAKELFGNHLTGLIFNWVPRSQLEVVEKEIVPFLSSRGVESFGAIQRDRTLWSVSISDLAERLQGELLCAKDKCNELVESFMVGAMGQEQALRYFRKKANKAVVTGGDRSDVILAALETSTTCLVLTGDYIPTAAVLGRAEELGVPAILVRYDTLTTIEMMESIMGRVRVHDPKKINRLKDLMRIQVDIDGLLNKVKSR